MNYEFSQSKVFLDSEFSDFKGVSPQWGVYPEKAMNGVSFRGVYNHISALVIFFAANG